MATKKITDLQLISAVTSSLNFPSDDGIQSYRATAEQIKNFVLANGNIALAMLATNIFNGLSAVTAADDDYFPLIDTSDSNLTKKALISTFARNLYRTVTNPSDEAILSTDGTVKITGTTGAVVLPTAVGIAGKRYKFIHDGSNFVQYAIKTTSSQTIGHAAITSGNYKLCTKGEVLEVESDGANWLIMGRFTETPWTDFPSVDAGTLITSTGTSPGYGTVAVNKAQWRRVGTDMLIRWDYRHSTGGSAGTGLYLFNLPANTEIDTSKATVNTTFSGNGGDHSSPSLGTFATGWNDGAWTGCLSAYSSTQLRATIGVYYDSSAGTGRSSWHASSGSPAFDYSPLYFGISAAVPISGWQP